MAKIRLPLRSKTKEISIGSLKIGANNPISIQSMIKTPTKDIKSSVRQISELEKIGCQIIRLAVKDPDDAHALRNIKMKTNIPLVADIHFNYTLALIAIDSGVDKIRVNPGNIYKLEHIKKIVKKAKKAKIPIRVGTNAGSLRSRLPGQRRRHQKSDTLADRMVNSTLSYIKILENLGFYDIVVSLKASDVFSTISAYRKISKLISYPLHLGVTATGSGQSAIFRSVIGIGSLLADGIGDTMRVSLTGSPGEEVRIAYDILCSLGLRSHGVEIISCPTCGRCSVDLASIVKKIEKKLNPASRKILSLNLRPIRVAIMGCEVNGPGEAKSSDLGIAFGKKYAVFFRDSKIIKKLSNKEVVNLLYNEMEKKICKNQ